jgi:hypothetical protein
LEGYVELCGEAVEVPTYPPCLLRCPFDHGFPHFLTALQPDVARRPSSYHGMREPQASRFGRWRVILGIWQITETQSDRPALPTP